MDIGKNRITGDKKKLPEHNRDCWKQNCSWQEKVTRI